MANSVEGGDNYVVAYACTRRLGVWDCHGNQWMLRQYSVEVRCENDLECPEGQFCDAGECIGMPEEPTVPAQLGGCVDSDGGRVYGVKGTITGSQLNWEPSNTVSRVFYDGCIDFEVLGTFSQAVDSCVGKPNCAINEYFCRGNKLHYEYILCPTDCVNGACIGSPSLPPGPEESCYINSDNECNGAVLTKRQINSCTGEVFSTVDNDCSAIEGTDGVSYTCVPPSYDQFSPTRIGTCLRCGNFLCRDSSGVVFNIPSSDCVLEGRVWGELVLNPDGTPKVITGPNCQ